MGSVRRTTCHTFELRGDESERDDILFSAMALIHFHDSHQSFRQQDHVLVPEVCLNFARQLAFERGRAEKEFHFLRWNYG